MNIERKATWSQQAILWVMGIFAIIVDQVTKYRIETTLEPYSDIRYPIEAWSHIFSYYHVFNKGAAFSFLGDGGFGWLFATVAFGVSIFLLIYNYTTRGDHIVLRLALGSVLGGALGNAFDRIRLGHVTDYIYFNFLPLVEDYPALQFDILNFPVFNWADIFVVSGVITLAILMVFDKIPEEEEEEGKVETETNTEPQPATATTAVPLPATPPPATTAVTTPATATDKEASDPKLARFGIWAAIIATLILIIWVVVVFSSWQRSRKQQKRNHTP
ncbi:MAG: signal peptidase II [Sphaerospermopsis sp. SIO1G2]|nr:signal peptidase II [Sphaerospermopsis sp. SIO1G2]